MKNKMAGIIITLLLCLLFLAGCYYLLSRSGPFAVILFGNALPVAGPAAPAAAALILLAIVTFLPARRQQLLFYAALVIVFTANYLYNGLQQKPLETISNPPLNDTDIKSKYADFNLILISLDTLRDDRVSVNGYERDTTPRLDEFAEMSVHFRNAYTPSSSTKPAHVSVFTGMYPGVVDGLSFGPIPQKVNFMAETLKLMDYRTAAFTGGGWMRADIGFDQGFDVFDGSESKLEGSWPLARSWLDENGGDRFFLFLHTYDIHAPYDPPEPFNNMYYPEYDGRIPGYLDYEMVNRVLEGEMKFTGDDLKYISALYDGGVRYTDRYIKEIMDFLAARNLLDETIVIIMSDHGEDLGEYGYVAWHAHILKEITIRVPLMIYVPGMESRTVETRVGLVDLLPTVFDLLGIDYSPGSYQGSSFADLLAGAAAGAGDRIIFSEQHYEDGKVKDGRLKSIITGNMKFTMTTPKPGTIPFRRIFDNFIYLTGARELYDLGADPAEKNNLVLDRINLACSLENTITNTMLHNRSIAVEPPQGSGGIPPAAASELKNLGYIK